jgi:hypothetical protein
MLPTTGHDCLKNPSSTSRHEAIFCIAVPPVNHMHNCTKLSAKNNYYIYYIIYNYNYMLWRSLGSNSETRYSEDSETHFLLRIRSKTANCMLHSQFQL